MMNLTADAVAGSLGQLPALRPIVVKLLESFDNARIDTNVLVNEIAQDQALSTRILRLANSSFYGLPSRVEALRDAVIMLGFRTVRAVAVAVSLTECFSGHQVHRFDTQGFWRHCAAVGMAARELARLTHRPEDVAFTAGVVHDIGLLALIWLYPDRMTQAMELCREQGIPIAVGEKQVLGVDHSEAGAALAKRWGLPQQLTDAIKHHENPDDARADSLADLIHVANVLVQQYGLIEICEIDPPNLSDVAVNRLGVGAAEIRQVIARLERDLEPTFHALFG